MPLEEKAPSREELLKNLRLEFAQLPWELTLTEETQRVLRAHDEGAAFVQRCLGASGGGQSISAKTLVELAPASGNFDVLLRLCMPTLLPSLCGGKWDAMPRRERDRCVKVVVYLFLIDDSRDELMAALTTMKIDCNYRTCHIHPGPLTRRPLHCTPLLLSAACNAPRCMRALLERFSLKSVDHADLRTLVKLTATARTTETIFVLASCALSDRHGEDALSLMTQVFVRNEPDSQLMHDTMRANLLEMMRVILSLDNLQNLGRFFDDLLRVHCARCDAAWILTWMLTDATSITVRGAQKVPLTRLALKQAVKQRGLHDEMQWHMDALRDHIAQGARRCVCVHMAHIVGFRLLEVHGPPLVSGEALQQLHALLQTWQLSPPPEAVSRDADRALWDSTLQWACDAVLEWVEDADGVRAEAEARTAAAALEILEQEECERAAAREAKERRSDAQAKKRQTARSRKQRAAALREKEQLLQKERASERKAQEVVRASEDAVRSALRCARAEPDARRARERLQTALKMRVGDATRRCRENVISSCLRDEVRAFFAARDSPETPEDAGPSAPTDDSDAPVELLCPIDLTLLLKAVVVVPCGHEFNEPSLQQFMDKCVAGAVPCPLCNCPVTAVVPGHRARQMSHDWMRTRAVARDEGT